MKYLTSPSRTLSSPQASRSATGGFVTRLCRSFALAAVATIALAACGSTGEPVSAGSGSDDTADTSENGITDPATDGGDDENSPGDDLAGIELDRDENGELMDYEEAIAEGAEDPATDYIQPIDPPVDGETAAEWSRIIGADVVAPGDIIDPKPWEIAEAFAITADDTEVLVRYTAGNPPCTQSRATVVETAGTIEISLEVGLHPNVAAMSCLAGTSGSEIAVPLKSPVGDREIVAVQP